MKITNKLFVYDNLFDRGEFKIDVGDIRQISELSIMPGTEIIEHIQHCDEITYAVSGKAKIYSGDICREMRPGQVHFIKTGVRHNIIADENNRFRYVCIGLTPNENNREIGGFMRDFQKKDFFFLQDNGDIRILTELLLNEFYRTDAYSRSMINLYLSQIIILLQRMLKKKEANPFRSQADSPKSDDTIYHVLRYIDREYLNIKSVQEIADKLSYSENYLSHLFKEKMGVTMKSYLIKKKIVHAETLLKMSDISMDAISEILNFSSVHTFYQAFVRLNNISPTEYRKQKTEK